MTRHKYVGMDVHSATTVIDVQNERGKTVSTSTIETKGGADQGLISRNDGDDTRDFRGRCARGLAVRADQAAGGGSNRVQSEAQQTDSIKEQV